MWWHRVEVRLERGRGELLPLFMMVICFLLWGCSLGAGVEAPSCSWRQAACSWGQGQAARYFFWRSGSWAPPCSWSRTGVGGVKQLGTVLGGQVLEHWLVHQLLGKLGLSLWLGFYHLQGLHASVCLHDSGGLHGKDGLV